MFKQVLSLLTCPLLRKVLGGQEVTVTCPLNLSTQTFCYYHAAVACVKRARPTVTLSLTKQKLGTEEDHVYPTSAHG